MLHVIHCLCMLLVFGSAQQTGNIEDIVRDVFSTNPSAQPPAGFSVIVTPEPNDPSNPQPMFNSISGKGLCNCVPYHMCDPSTNSITEDGEFDGFGLIDLRVNIDDPVCPHYLDVCCDNNRTRSESLTPTPQDTRSRGCGIRKVGGIDFNITGNNDNEAGFGEFPWTVALLHSGNSSFFCAGSLIHPRVVLTAAHCILDKSTESFLVRAGEWDSQTVLERLPYAERNIQRIVLHPQFNSRNVANNFALLILNNAFSLEDHINVVCLPSQSSLPVTGTSCLSTGWGKDVFGALGRYSAIMKRISLPIVDFNDCQQRLKTTRLGPRFALHSSFVCAGGELNKDTCEGDGGAPLVCPIGLAGENRYEQTGIVSWGIGCNQAIPAAYANVATARDWIDSEMLSNGFDTAVYSSSSIA